MANGRTGHRNAQKEHFEGKSTLLERLIKHPSYARTMRKKIAFIRRELAGCSQILEVGTGHGLELGLLLEGIGGDTTYVGVDLAAAPLRSAYEAATRASARRAGFLAADTEHLPFAAGTFDGVYCVDVLHHAESQARMLAEIRRVLRPRGTVICVEPNPMFPVSLLFLRDPIENGLFKFTHKNAARWAHEAGLVDLRILQLPIYLPSFPATLGPAYERAERIIGRVPLVREISTARVLLARCP
jgi:ubiquinone/menaquinone biosynthesis C-methylase UbiE